ncbi:hypothetical protein ACTFIT_010741 [Dictyostelium discoideum]
MNQYKNVNIVNNCEQVKESIKEIFEITYSPYITNVKDPKRVISGGAEYFIYKEDSMVLNGTTHVAIAPSTKTIKTGSIPTSVQALLLLDGFNVELTEGSIPNGVYYLLLFDGFNQEITEIPQSVNQLILFDTPLTKFPYSKTIYRSTKYKQQLTYPNVNNWDGVWETKLEL